MLAFIHIHKTGGSTLEWILRSTYGSRFAVALPWQKRWVWQEALMPEDLRKLLRVYPNLQSFGSHNVRAYAGLEEVVPSLRYFTFVRDPLHQRVAMYQHGRRSEITWQMMLKHPIKYGWNRYESGLARGKQESRSIEVWLQAEDTQNRMTKMIAGVPDAGKAIALIEQKQIFVGLTEAFDESLVLLRQLVAPELDLAYTRRNVTPDRSESRRILSDSALRQMLAEGNEEDIELYGYVRDVLFPSYRQAAAAQQSRGAPGPGPVRTDFNQRNLLFFEVKHKALYRPTIAFYRKFWRESH